MSEKNGKVLIVDDEHLSVATLKHILAHDYEVFMASSGKEGLEIAEAELPDLILLDIMMPVMDGYEVFNLIRKNPLLCDIPILFITALTEAECEVRGLELGAHDYLTKPYIAAMVRLRVKNHLEFKRRNDLVKKQRDLLAQKNEQLEKQEELLATEELLRMQIIQYEASQRQLKESEERFRTLSEASFGGIIIHDKGYILDCNLGLSALTGFNFEELIGTDSLKLIAPDWRDLVTQHIQNSFDQRYEVMGVRKDGTTYNLLIIGKDIPYKGRTVRVAEYRDITERKQADEKRQLLEQQFHQAQKLESLGLLAGGIAHDINNILTVIMLQCYMAREDRIQETGYKAAFQKIETAGNRAADLCRQMLTYSGKSPLEQTSVNLWLLIDEIVKMLHAAIKKNVTIELDLKRDVPAIKGDSAQLQQIIMNLVINAADAIGETNGTIRVALSKTVFEAGGTDAFGTAIKAGGYACLEVTDSGCGMDEETQKRIFEPFYSTKITGRGLGMSAIQGIVNSHDGILHLTSSPGFGATFKVCLPITPAPDCPKATPSVSAPSKMTGGNILLVDDEEVLRIMGVELLESMGFSVLSAQHGGEAVEIYKERGNDIDVILLDMIMPVIGGIEAYHELRKIDPSIAIIICSVYGVKSLGNNITNDPHAGFVRKPYKPEELRDVIVNMMA